MSSERLGASFGIDITNLKAGLTQANRLIRESESEFKAAAAGMDNWTKSQEGLEAKIKSLNTISDLQKKKVEALEAEYSRLISEGLDPASASAVKMRTDINKQKEALAKTEKELQTYTTALEELADESDGAADNVNDLADAVDEADSKAEGAGGGFTVLKGAIADLVSDGIQWAIDKFKELASSSDTALNSLQAQTGMTSEEIAAFKDEMDDLYKNNYGESMEDLANAFATVTQTSGETDPSKVKELAKNAIVLRDTFGFEVNESMRAANMLMDQFGVTGDEAFELIAQGAQNGLNKNGDLLDVINEYGVHFKDQGYSAEEFFNSLKNGTDAGTFSVDKLGDAMKEFGVRSKDNTKSTADAFAQLGLTASDNGQSAKDLFDRFAAGGETAREATDEVLTALFSMEDATAQNEAGVALFGTMWEDLGAEGVKALMDVNGEMDKSGDKLKEIDEVKYSDITSQFKQLGRTIETDLIKPIAEKVLPKVQELVSKVTKNMPEIKKKIQGVVKVIKDISPVLAAVGAAIAGLALVGVISNISAIGTALLAVIKSTKLFTAAQWLLNAAMNANPISLVVVAIGALVAAFAVLWKKSDKFRNFWINLWEKVKDVAGKAWEKISEFFSAAWDFIKTTWNKVKPYFVAVWNGIKEPVAKIIESIKNAFQQGWELIKVIWDKVKPYFEAIWEAIKTVFSVVKEVLTVYFQSAWEAIKGVWDIVVQYFTMIWENIKAVFSVVKTFFEGAFKTAWEVIKAVWDNVTGYFQAIWDTIAGVFSVVKDVLTGDFKGAWEGIKGIISTWAKYFGGVWDNIKKVFASVKNWFSSTFSAAWTAIKKVFSNVGEFFSGIWDTIKKTFKSIGTKVGDAIGGTFKTAINAVIATVEKGLNVIPNTINKALDKINELPGVDIGEMSTISLPRLAKGGVVRRATSAIIGEDGAEAVVPLERNTKWLDALADRLGGKIGGGVTVNQTNNYSQAHSRYEIYKSKQQTAAAVRLALGGGTK